MSRAELVIDSQDIIHGIQFDILYNPLEIKSVTALQIYGYEVKYKQVSDTLIRGQIFSLQEEALPKSIKFDLINTDGFTGISIVQFQDIILATLEADVIQLENQFFNWENQFGIEAGFSPQRSADQPSATQSPIFSPESSFALATLRR